MPAERLAGVDASPVPSGRAHSWSAIASTPAGRAAQSRMRGCETGPVACLDVKNLMPIEDRSCQTICAGRSGPVTVEVTKTSPDSRKSTGTRRRAPPSEMSRIMQLNIRPAAVRSLAGTTRRWRSARRFEESGMTRSYRRWIVPARAIFERKPAPVRKEDRPCAGPGIAAVRRRFR